MSVTAARGFVAAGGAVGIKGAGAPDFAVVATEDGKAVEAAGVFTENLAAAAPVRVSRAHLVATGGHAAGVVLTSGNANAATGEPGRVAAERLCGMVAEGVGAAPNEILVCQTGLIGVPFPLDVALGGAVSIVAELAGGGDAGRAAATAIMTTDTFCKEAVLHCEAGDGVGTSDFTIGGMAKGAAMLAPNMATMLAVLTTDAAVDAATLTRALREGVGSSFNRMSVDGCTSTNDTVLLLASGIAGPVTPVVFADSVAAVCADLSQQMVSDAEGATKFVVVRVVGAGSNTEAHQAARKVADSLLVKCSLNGEDPYWGRIVSELGSAGVTFNLDRTSVSYGGIAVCTNGVALTHDVAGVGTHLAGRTIEIECDLGLGEGSGAVLGTDLGYGYLDENRTTS